MNTGSIIIMILFVVISILSQSQKQKKKEEAKKRAQAAASSGDPAVPSQNVERRAARAFPADDRFPDLAPRKAPPRTAQALADDRFPDLTPRKAPLRTASSSLNEGLGSSGSMRVSSSEGIGSGGSLKMSMNEAPQSRHSVKPMTESTHAHTESSMSGIIESCPPEISDIQTAANAAYNVPSAARLEVQSAANAAYNLPDAAVQGKRFSFERGSVTQGLLYGEILGKPKALRR